MNVNTEQLIDDIFSGVDFGDYEAVLTASQGLNGVSGSEVIQWVTENLPYWNWNEVFRNHGLRNLEKIFETKFELKPLINTYFCEDSHWVFYRSADQYIKEFNLLSGRNITVDDVTENISIDFLIETCGYGPGLVDFLRFVIENNGDPEILIDRITPEIQKFPVWELDSFIQALEERCTQELVERVQAEIM